MSLVRRLNYGNFKKIMKKPTILRQGSRIKIVIIGIVVVGAILFVAQTNITSRNTLKKASSLQASLSTNQSAGLDEFANYQKPSPGELQKNLSPIQYDVTQKDATETSFDNPYWDSKEVGIYVDVVSGEPLFSSRDKYDSGTGWPSFTKPIDAKFIITKKDTKLGYARVEARSTYADSHLGHVFNDGPTTQQQSRDAEPTGLRYCMNSAALRFIPKTQLKEQGLSAYEALL